MRSIVRQGQSLFDLSIQQSGSMESVFLLARQLGVSIVDDQVVGTEMDTAPTLDRNIRRYYDENRIMPATALTGAGGGELLDGIGFMAVQIDFWVR